MKRSLILFVHGFESDARCWSDLTRLMKDDPAIQARFDLMCFEYAARLKKLLWHPLRGLPEYGEIAGKFETFVELNFTAAYDELYLVGHSQGGLIVQDWLVRRLNSGEGRKLRRVREVLLIATPTLGSDLGGSLRRAVIGVLHDTQEQRLRPVDSQVADTRPAVEKQVMAARICDDHNCPIPIVSFWGEEDGVVRSASAEASFEHFIVVPGEHSSILHPKDRAALGYRAIAETLLLPQGHRYIFEIDSYETTVAVEPLTGDKQEFAAKRGGAAVTEHSDNFARIIRKVCFSSKNHCTDLFRFNRTADRIMR